MKASVKVQTSGARFGVVSLWGPRYDLVRV